MIESDPESRALLPDGAFAAAIEIVLRVIPGALLLRIDERPEEEVPRAPVSGKQPGTAAHAPPP